MKIKQNPLFLFLITDKNLSIIDYHLWISKMDDSNIIKGSREELEILFPKLEREEKRSRTSQLDTYYKVSTLPIRGTVLHERNLD